MLRYQWNNGNAMLSNRKVFTASKGFTMQRPHCDVTQTTQRHSFLILHNTIHPYVECVPWRYFWWERFNSSNGFTWEFKDKVCDFKKQYHGFSRGKWKCSFKSPDNKINRQFPVEVLAFGLTKANVSAVQLKRPLLNSIILTVRLRSSSSVV